MHGNGVRAPARGARGASPSRRCWPGCSGSRRAWCSRCGSAPRSTGQVVDQATGKPIAGAIVVVRFDGRYDDVLPDRDLIGHEEALTDASGRFQMDRIVRAGFSAWPLFKTEARVVGVMHEGYRCAAPRAAPESGLLRIALIPALDTLDRRDSCRPVTAERGEVTAYMDAWRTLFADDVARAPDESERQVERLLAARTVLGFGENCTGPVTDLAVAPDGARAAIHVAGSDAAPLQRIELASGARRAIDADVGAAPDARLAWLGSSELVMVEPEATQARSLASLAAARVVRLWSATDAQTPAAPAAGLGRDARPRPLDPESLSDESDRYWGGRSFALARTLDPTTGLSADELRVTREDGSRFALTLPGEACGQAGRFGRPQYRMTADGRSGLDLRFVGGGCHAVRIDLETGAWQTPRRGLAARAVRNRAQDPVRKPLGGAARLHARGGVRPLRGRRRPCRCLRARARAGRRGDRACAQLRGRPRQLARPALPARDTAAAHRRRDRRSRAPRSAEHRIVAADAGAAVAAALPAFARRRRAALAGRGSMTAVTAGLHTLALGIRLRLAPAHARGPVSGDSRAVRARTNVLVAPALPVHQPPPCGLEERNPMKRIRPLAVAIAAILTLGVASLVHAQQIQDAEETGAVTGSITNIDPVNSTVTVAGPNNDGGTYKVNKDTGIMNGAKKIGHQGPSEGLARGGQLRHDAQGRQRREADRGGAGHDSLSGIARRIQVLGGGGWMP